MVVGIAERLVDMMEVDMLEFSGKILNYSFGRRINIIGGKNDVGLNSGTGKTRFFTALYSSFNNNEQRCNYEVVFINDIIIIDELQIRSGVCYIIDEANLSSKILTGLYNKVVNYDVYLILIGRLFTSIIPFTVDSIFSLDLVGEVYSLYPAFAYEFDKVIDDRWYAAVEDSDKVADYYNKIIEPFDVDVKFLPANGKDKIIKNASRSKNAFLIADNAKFGSVLLNFIPRWENSNLSEMVLFLPDCFEEVLLGPDFDIKIKNYIDEGVPIDVFDAESYCEQLIDRICCCYDKKRGMKRFWECLENKTVLGCDNCDNWGKNEIIRILVMILQGLYPNKEVSSKLCFEVNDAKIHDYVLPQDLKKSVIANIKSSSNKNSNKVSKINSMGVRKMSSF